MFYDPRNDPHGLPRDPFKSLVVPRPIGWISTVSSDGVFNLGPYSFFNGVSTDPAVVMFGCGGGTLADGKKDSWKNAEDTGEFVVNIVDETQHREMNETSADVPPDVDEFVLAGLTMEPSQAVKPPRVKGAPVHLECEFLQAVELPSDVPGKRNAMVLGTVVGIHIDDSIITDGFVDMKKFRPVARLGYMDYTVVDNVFTMLRPGM
jgi:flavin reductase (DIM6/NTAB) family NADH-FMN oxidoreductase RutF